MKRIISAFLLTVLLLAACEKSPAGLTVNPPSQKTEETVSAAAEEKEKQPSYTITASEPDGIYTKENRPASVVLTTDSGCVIKYTTSTCTEPDTYSQLATDPIRLAYKETGDGMTECAIIRAALFKGGKQIGPTYTFTYFSAPENRFTTPVISLVSDPAGLYSHETGILVEGKAREDALKHGNPEGWVLSNTNANFYNGGKEWERPVSIAFSETGEGAFAFTSNGGMRVNGGWTRANRQKSLKLFSRKEYTPDYGTFAIDLFPGYRDPLTGMTNSFANTILIRGGSNNEGSTVIGTPLQLRLCEGTQQILPAIRPVTEFINGEYKGMFYFIEDYDADFIEAHFGVPEEELAIFSGSFENYGGSMWTLDTGTEDDFSRFMEVLKKLGAMNMRKEENYAYACEVLDMRNFIEYICIEMYCANSDWPDNNLRVFCVTPEYADSDSDSIRDGRYRFLLKDLDLAFGSGHPVTSNPYGTMNSGSRLGIREVFTALMKNDHFSDQVYMYMCTLASTVFDPARVQVKIDEFVLSTMGEMTLSTEVMHVGGGSASKWQGNLNGLVSFAKARVNAVLDVTERYSRCSLTDVTVKINGEGTAQLGWYEAENGTVVTTLTDTPIPLELTPDAKVTVTGGTHENGVLRFDKTEASVTITFGKAEGETAADGVVINEVSYRGSGQRFVELYNGTDSTLSLDGWSIGTTFMQSLDGCSVKAGGYLILSDNGDIPLTIPLSKNHTLTLYHGDTVVDCIDLFTVNRTVQLGRYPDGRELVTLYACELTPGESNAILEPFAWDMQYKSGVMIGDRFYPTEEMELIDGEVQVPVTILRNYLRDIRTVYRKEWDWVDEHKGETIPFSGLAAFIEENMRIRVRTCASANVIIIG